jgi:hypothetical protein
VTSTPSLFSWLTIITFGENKSLRAFFVDSRDELVSRFMISTLPFLPAYLVLMVALRVASVTSEALNSSAASPSSGKSASSFFLLHLYLRNLSVAERLTMNYGVPKVAINSRKASKVGWVYPSKMNLTLSCLVL